MSTKLAIVTGANKGIGFEIAKALCAKEGFHVIAAARDESRGQEAVEKLKGGKSDISFMQLDISDQKSVDTFAQQIKSKYDGIDILINNAGVASKGDDFNEEIAENTLKVNFFGLLRICDALFPMIKDHGRVVHISSSSGNSNKLGEELRATLKSDKLTREKLEELMHQFPKDVAEGKFAEKGWPRTAYGVSKMGVSALTTIQARTEFKDKKDVIVTAVNPGWCRTDMAGDKAPHPPSYGAEAAMQAAFLPEGTPSGQYYDHTKLSEW